MEFQFDVNGKESNVEGDFAIVINENCVFHQTNVDVLKFGMALANWLLHIQKHSLIDFEYPFLRSEKSVLQFHTSEERMDAAVSVNDELIERLPLEVIQRAARNYCIDLQITLLRANREMRLDDVLQEIVSTNQWALILYEGNRYEEAYALIEKCANETPTIQSLNNYAYFLLREEENEQRALEVLRQLIRLQPQSDFPYLMLGEIFILQKQFEQAKHSLQQALQFLESEEALFDLGIASFHLGEFEQAAHAFSKCKGDSNMTRLHEVVSWMYAGETMQAKKLLKRWNEEADDYTGSIEIADVYVELGCFVEARAQFEKEMAQYYITPYVISRYAYTLWQLGETELCKHVVEEAIRYKTEELADELQTPLDEHWSAEDRAQSVALCEAQLRELQMLIGRLQQRFVPPFDYELYPLSGCQLFGCHQHRHAEYVKR